MTAKDTQFGKKTFTSWLIESVGTVPIKRRQEHGEETDNTLVLGNLVSVSRISTVVKWVWLLIVLLSRWHLGIVSACFQRE